MSEDAAKSEALAVRIAVGPPNFSLEPGSF